MNKRLFEPVNIGDLKLKNRIAMAPMTRGRAGETRVPKELHPDGLIRPFSPPVCGALGVIGNSGSAYHNTG